MKMCKTKSKSKMKSKVEMQGKIGQLQILVDSELEASRVRGEWPSGLYRLRRVTEVKLDRVRSDSGWVTSEA